MHTCAHSNILNAHTTLTSHRHPNPDAGTATAQILGPEWGRYREAATAPSFQEDPTLCPQPTPDLW